MPDPFEFVIDHGQNQVVDGEVEIIGYGPGGKVLPVTAVECLARKSFDPATGVYRFWLKRATAGPEQGTLYNPHSPMFEKASTQRVYSHLGRGQYEFFKVSQEAFDSYLMFLKTGNPIHLRQAERL